MPMKKKVLCKWSKTQIAKNHDQLLEIATEPTHLCKDCGRVANDKKWLCKPVKV